MTEEYIVQMNRNMQGLIDQIQMMNNKMSELEKQNQEMYSLLSSIVNTRADETQSMLNELNQQDVSSQSDYLKPFGEDDVQTENLPGNVLI